MFPGSSQAAALQLPRGHCNTKTSCEYMRMTFLDRSSSSLSYYNFVDVNFPCSNSFLLPEFPSGSLCRSRRELSNDPFIAETGVDHYNVSRKLGCIWQCHGSSTGDPLARSLWWDTAIGIFWSKFQKKKSLIVSDTDGNDWEDALRLQEEENVDSVLMNCAFLADSKGTPALKNGFMNTRNLINLIRFAE